MFRGKIRHVAKSEVYNKPLASTGMAGYDESWFPLVPSPNARACRLLSPLGPLVRLPVPAAHWALAPPPPVRPVRQHHWPEQRTTTKHTKKGRRTAEAIACLFLPVGAADCKAVNWLRRPATPVLRACVRACLRVRRKGTPMHGASLPLQSTAAAVALFFHACTQGRASVRAAARGVGASEREHGSTEVNFVSICCYGVMGYGMGQVGLVASRSSRSRSRIRAAGRSAAALFCFSKLRCLFLCVQRVPLSRRPEHRNS
jgi:hypothetical protein